jgi:hypothetical protein
VEIGDDRQTMELMSVDIMKMKAVESRSSRGKKGMKSIFTPARFDSSTSRVST